MQEIDRQRDEHTLGAGAPLPDWKGAPFSLDHNQWLCCLDIEMKSV